MLSFRSTKLPISTIGVTVVVAYVATVRLLRYRRAQNNAKAIATARSTQKDKDELMEEYRSIIQDLSTLEFPLMWRLSLEFALFRTYTIPSISKLLEQTVRFEKDCGKRYDDTDLLLRELLENPFTSDRSQTALQRINFIHGQFQGKITNDDMIYVLSVFILEPIRWIYRFEWRELTEEECTALFEVWCHLGKRMGIQNFPDTLEKFEAWNQDYEQQNMVYADSNITISEATVTLFLGLAPSFLHPLGRQVAYCLMDDRLRAAANYPDPSPTLQRTVMGMVNVRKFMIQYFSPPRPGWLSARRSPFVGSVNATLCPRYNVYATTYKKNGYRVNNLGDAPPARLASSCPIYSGRGL